MANFGEGSRRGSGGMLPLLALSAVAEYCRLPWKPPVTAGLLAANTLVYLRPTFIDPVIPHISEVWFNPHLILKVTLSISYFRDCFSEKSITHMIAISPMSIWNSIFL